MDKIAAEIFAPLLAGMAGKPLTRAIQSYRDVEALHQSLTIRVPLIEVELSSRNPGDADTWRTAVLDHHLTQRAYELLVEAYPDVFEAIARRLAEGKIK
jgi:hypothetical protein